MATEYISREAAIGKITALINKSGKYTAYESGADDACYIVEHEIPTADVRPVVHGKWNHDGSDWKNRFICDQCGYKWFFEAEEARFCPNCGADMRPEWRTET